MKYYILQWRLKEPVPGNEWMDHYRTVSHHPDLRPADSDPIGLKVALDELRESTPDLEWRVISREVIETVVYS